MKENKAYIDQSKQTHKISEELKQKIRRDLAEQKKRKEAWRRFSDPVLAIKHGVTTSTLEYMKRNPKK